MREYCLNCREKASRERNRVTPSHDAVRACEKTSQMKFKEKDSFNLIFIWIDLRMYRKFPHPINSS